MNAIKNLLKQFYDWVKYETGSLDTVIFVLPAVIVITLTYWLIRRTWHKRKFGKDFKAKRRQCRLNETIRLLSVCWLCNEYTTEQKVVFPYGNKYGWCISHKKKKKLLCNIFAENNSFTVMMRLSDRQYESVYGDLREYTQNQIDNKYPCGDGGWIHYRVTCKEHFDDVKKLLAVKCS